MGAKKLKDVIDQTDNVVMLKVYRNYKEIVETLDQLNLTANSILISRCGLDGEEIVQDLKRNEEIHSSYLSLLLIKKKHRG
jgi:precorrin-2/cobalt-factor-2 C20-methyltransferase